MRVSPKRIGGWEPTYTATPRRGPDGKQRGWTITADEAEWDDDQIAVLLALQEELAIEKGPHGQPMSEATDARADVNKRGGWHYEGYHTLDHAAREDERYRKQLERQYPDGDFSGFIYAVRKVEDD